MGLGLLVSSLSKHANHSNNPGTWDVELDSTDILTVASMALSERGHGWIQQNWSGSGFPGPL